MRWMHLLLLAGALGGAYHWWQGRNGGDGIGVIGALGEAATAKDFVPVQMPDGAPGNTVLILAPPDCPSDEAQRAESLALALASKGVPVSRSGAMSFNVVNPTPEQVAGVKRAVAVFKQGAPAVFVNGMGMSNPSAEQVLAVYRGKGGK